MSFRIDTTTAMPITIPDATSSQDGVMTAAQVAQLDAASDGTGAYYWTLAKTWAQVWAEVQAGGGYGIILIENTTDFSSRIVTAGTYDFSGVIFRGLGGALHPTIMDFAAGVLIDGGSSVILTGENIFINASAALMTAGSKTVNISLRGYCRFRRTVDVTLFDTTSTANDILLETAVLNAGSSAYTTPLIFLRSSAFALQLTMVGLNGGSILSGKVAGGLAGSEANFAGTALSGINVSSDFLIAPTVFSSNTVAGKTQTVAARAAMVSNTAKGSLVYNTTTREFEHWDGTAWRSHVAPIVGADLASAATVALVERIHAITGSAAIDTLTLPWTGFTGDVTLLVPAGATWTLTTGGNIASAKAPAAGTSVKLTFNGTLWYPGA